MPDLGPELTRELERLYPGARREMLAGDASTRRFHRLISPDGGTCIVMEYGRPFEGETDDVRLARIFAAAGLPVARVLHILPSAGALVLSDLGDETLERASARQVPAPASARRELYRSAVRLAAAVATRGTEALSRSDRARSPALDEERFLFEMRFFLEHFAGSFLGRKDPPPAVRAALERLAVEAAAHPRVLCHRDFHSRNLMVVGDSSLAMVDIQDARWGPDTYDLASLLRDAYVELPEEEVNELFEIYRSQLPRAIAAAELRRRFDVVAAQRMIKALGTFGYQTSVMGRNRYRDAIPRTVARLRQFLPARPETAGVGEALLSAGLLTL